MTPDDVRRRVDEIRACAGDDEAAHGREDVLFRDVLQAIANGHDMPAHLARLALESREIEFDRWCA